jgi:hypothetical protein
MKEKLLDLPYFKAPISHAIFYYGGEPDSHTCDCCKQNSKYTFDNSPDINKKVYVCLQCLIARKFSIDQDTELGGIVNGKLQECRCKYEPDINYMMTLNSHEKNRYLENFYYGEYTKEVPCPKGFNSEALIEIGFTPPIATYQSSRGKYLCHCNDFMTYVGQWSPSDFDKNAKDGDGKSLWISTVDEDQDDFLWDCTFEEIKKYGEKEWRYSSTSTDWASGALVYVFKCRHCNKLRCYWECD